MAPPMTTPAPLRMTGNFGLGQKLGGSGNRLLTARRRSKPTTAGSSMSTTCVQ
jgi:hypothetical protein